MVQIKAIVYTAKSAKCVKFGKQDRFGVLFITINYDMFSCIYKIISMSIGSKYVQFSDILLSGKSWSVEWRRKIIVFSNHHFFSQVTLREMLDLKLGWSYTVETWQTHKQVLKPGSDGSISDS